MLGGSAPVAHRDLGCGHICEASPELLALTRALQIAALLLLKKGGVSLLDLIKLAQS